MLFIESTSKPNIRKQFVSVSLEALGIQPSRFPKLRFSWSAQPAGFELLVNGLHRPLCRYPVDEFLKVKKGISNRFTPGDHLRYPNGRCPICDAGRDVALGSLCVGENNYINQAGIVFTCEDPTLSSMLPLLQGEEELWAFGYFKWGYAFDNVRISSIHQEEDIVLKGVHPSYYGVLEGEEEAKRFYLYNALVFLDGGS